MDHYLGKERPSFQMVNDYVFCYCQDNDVALAAFQEVGHPFRYISSPN